MKPHLPPINETALREAPWEDVFQSVTLEDFVASYLTDYNGRKALRRLGLWKGREAQVAEILLERDDVQNELSLRQLEVTEANMAAIRARAMQGLYQLALGAESESVRLQALGRLLDVTGGATTKSEVMDLSNTESVNIKEALAAIGRAPVL
jgi:hypothetical protein|nr:MAG TPA: hypothetical protein [Caudoviricetes sp.]